MIVSSLHRYPVKSLRGHSCGQATVDPWGIVGDRRWMLVDRAGEKLWAGRHHQLLSITATVPAEGGLLLSATPGDSELRVAEPVDGERVPVGLRGVGTALAAGEEADAWLSDHLGLDVRLVWLEDPRRRPMSESHGGRAGDVLSFADAAPLLLTTQPSLRRLDDWIAESEGALAMERFRPNLVVDGDLPPFAEDRWSRIRVGDVEFRFAELCDRCAVTTIDPDTGRSGKEPLRSLARHRRWDGHVWFGIRIVPVRTGTIALGDPVHVLS